MANTCADGKARLIGASGTLYVVSGCAVCCTAIGKPAPQTVNSAIRIMFPHSFLLSSNAKSSIETVRAEEENGHRDDAIGRRNKYSSVSMDVSAKLDYYFFIHLLLMEML
jgi:hypothetical protein